MWEGTISDANVTNNNAVQVDVSTGVLAFIEANQSLSQYELKQFHFHAPSEHTFNGSYYDLELHLVHINI